MSNRWRWIGKDFALAAHARLLADYGGVDGVRDMGALESALSRPKNLDAYGKPGISELAACYAVAIAKAHAFFEGNKRTAWAVTRTFLRNNGFGLTFAAPEAVMLMEAVARGDTDANALSSWLYARMKPIP